jgi:hypothetical protein
LEYINTVFEFISKNFSEEACFKHQLARLYDSLGIWLEMDGLELIWEHCSARKLSKV